MAAERGNWWPMALAVLLWAALTLAGLVLRPLLPVDETRYLTVAWEMWIRGDFLVPHLNGEPYGHKTPLLFWLMHLGWAAGGVGETWPRLIAPLAGLACLFLTRALGRALWPHRPSVGAMAPLLLLAVAAWPALTTTVMFDSLLAACVLLGLLGAARCADGGDWRGWLLMGIGFGLGALAKGPAVLPHLLLVPLLGPLWAPGDNARRLDSWRRWWTGLAVAGAIGAAIFGAWAIPALLDGASGFAVALFRDQIGERVVDAEDHGRALWWYVLALPPALLPLLLWPALWRGAGIPREVGWRFCATWFIGAVVSLSLISGKQLHYFLPTLPALALLAAACIADLGNPARRRGHAWGAGLVAILGFAVAVSPWLPLGDAAAAAVSEAAPAWGALLAAAAVAAAVLPLDSTRRQGAVLASLTVATAVTVHLVAAPLLAARFDLHPIAQRLSAWEREGRPIANYGEYHGQYHFLGRLRRPIEVVGDAESAAWTAAHPQGIVVTYQQALPAGASPLYVQPFRGRLVTVWPAAAVLADPTVVHRTP